MPVEERRARHQALLAAIHDYDVDRWQREFLAALRGEDGATASVTRISSRRNGSEIIYSGSTGNLPLPRTEQSRVQAIGKNG
jgi:hypothetical protein